MSYKQMVKILITVVLFVGFSLKVVKAKCINTFVFLRTDLHKESVKFKVKKVVIFDAQRNYLFNDKVLFFDSEKDFSQVFLGNACLPKSKRLKIKLEIDSLSFGNKKVNCFKKNVEGRIIFKNLKREEAVLIVSLHFVKKKNCWNGSLASFVPTGVNTIRLILGIDKKNQGLWVINTLENRVEWFKEVKGFPVYLSKGKNGVYVVCKAERVLKVLDPRNLELQQKFFLGEFEDPEFLLIDGDKGLILSPADKQVGLIDLNTGQVISRKYIDYTPNYASLIKNLREYAVSTEEGKVLIFDEDLNLIKEITVSFTPKIVFSINDKLYVGEVTGEVDVFDLGTYALVDKLNVCRGRVNDVELVGNRVYLACSDGTLAYFYVSQPNFIEKEFFNQGIERLCYDPYNGGIYFSIGNKVEVLDNLSGSITGEIQTGGDIYEMVDLP